MVDASPLQNASAAEQQLVALRDVVSNATFNTEATKHIENLCEENNLSFGHKDKYIEEENKRLVSTGKTPCSLGSAEQWAG